MVAVIALAFAAGAVFGAQGRFVEDFSTTLHCDAAGTTAEWDTLAGKLCLPSFAMTGSGSYETADRTFGLALDGVHAYLADWDGGLVVVDVSDPAAPTQVGHVATPGSAFRVTVAGDLAFVAASTGGLQIVDVSNPRSPAQLGVADTPGSAYGVAWAGRYVYVADRTGGLQVIDVADPYSPFVAGAYDTPGYAYGLAVAGDHVFLADGESGLRVLDVSDPTTPLSVSVFDTPGYAWDVLVAGDTAYIADNSGGLIVLDVSDPSKPVQIGVCATPDAALGLDLAGDHLYVSASTAGLLRLDVSDPTQPVIVETFDTPGRAYGVATAGSHAMVADHTSGLRIVEICTHSPNPPLVGQVLLPSTPSDMVVSGDLMFLATYSGFSILDLSAARQPIVLSSLAFSDQIYGLALAGDRVYLASDDDSLMVVDVEDPENPFRVGACGIPAAGRAVEVAGDLACVSMLGLSQGDLCLVDISDPTAPAVISTMSLGYLSKDVDIAGNLLYVALSHHGFAVVDVSDPGKPQQIGDCSVAGITDVAEIVLHGNTAYVSSSTGDIFRVDVSVPAGPVVIDAIESLHTPFDLELCGDLLYVAEGGGYEVFDVGGTPFRLLGDESLGPLSGVTRVGDNILLSQSGAINVIEVARRDLNLDLNVGLSGVIDIPDGRVIALRIETEQSGDALWQVEASGTGQWVEPEVGGGYLQLNSAAFCDSVRWRTELYHDPVACPDPNPTVTRVEIEWLHDYAAIDSIVDVPADQGGWARVHFGPSGWDLAGYECLASGYTLFRRVDDPSLQVRVAAATAEAKAGAPGSVLFEGKEYVDAVGDLADDFPPGLWEAVGGVPAYQADRYLCLAPTLADSGAASRPTVYCLFTRTADPTVYYVSPPDSGWSVDNMAPSIPTNLTLAAGSLSWDSCPDVDFDYFTIYGSSTPDLSASEVIGYTTGAEYDVNGLDYHYLLVTATDFAGNEGEAAVADAMTGVAGMPSVTRLLGAAPNPFNPRTAIRFDLRERGRVVLSIHDVAGRLVRTLVDGEEMAAGHRETAWNGRDDAGRPVPAGAYLCRLRAGGERDAIRLMLVK